MRGVPCNLGEDLLDRHHVIGREPQNECVVDARPLPHRQVQRPEPELQQDACAHTQEGQSWIEKGACMCVLPSPG